MRNNVYQKMLVSKLSALKKNWQYLIGNTLLMLFTASIVFTVFVYLRLTVSIYQAPKPQALLVLGGGYEREERAAQLAAQHSELKIWVSSGLFPKQANVIFLEHEVSLERVNLDYRATDTVTNFTTMIAQLSAHNYQHIYLVTSDFHMLRAKAIAFWILGSHGIVYTPVPVTSDQLSEPYYKVVRDVARSWLWLLTGRTGSSLDPEPPNKFP